MDYSRIKTLFFLLSFLQPIFLNAQPLPTQVSTIFSGSGNCAPCHAPGLPNTSALLGPNGEDISPVTYWRATMMANSARDPYWQARVTAEVAAHPQLQTLIEDECATCHAPIGHREAVSAGIPYTLQDLQQDTLALDGVSCTVCHQIQDVNFGQGSSFSGGYVIENYRLIYGPYENPQHPNLMVTTVHYTPVHGPHMLASEHCATCHTLFTPTIDNSGQIVGEAPEQTPYLEWKNSIYPALDIQCQTCHAPAIDFPVVISTMPPFLSSRTPYYKHAFVGGNAFMLRILRDHAAELGATAAPADFDSTIARTLKLLRRETAELSASARWRSDGDLEIKLAIRNKAGHKLPSGYPSRRVWANLEVSDPFQQTVFESGAWDAQSGEIIGLDLPYEPHHDLISDPGQVAVYQSILKDVDGQATHILLRAAGYAKDNRIPPAGFRSDGAHYDSTAIAGLAAGDPNFNRSNGQEGSGSDTVTYRIAGLSPASPYTVTAKLLYQSIAPREAMHLFQYSSPEIERFAGYYQQADKAPLLIDSLRLPVQPTAIAAVAATPPHSALLLRAYPNPFNPETRLRVTVPVRGEFDLTVYNLLGEEVTRLFSGSLTPGEYSYFWNARNHAGQEVSSGLYLLSGMLRESHTGNLRRVVEKVVYLK